MSAFGSSRARLRLRLNRTWGAFAKFLNQAWPASAARGSPGPISPPPMPFFAPVAFRICTHGLDVGAGQKWVNHILPDPALRQWESAALAETWRGASHEADLAGPGRSRRNIA